MQHHASATGDAASFRRCAPRRHRFRQQVPGFAGKSSSSCSSRRTRWSRTVCSWKCRAVKPSKRVSDTDARLPRIDRPARACPRPCQSGGPAGRPRLPRRSGGTNGETFVRSPPASQPLPIGSTSMLSPATEHVHELQHTNTLVGLPSGASSQPPGWAPATGQIVCYINPDISCATDTACGQIPVR